jgi:hypothetical protein
MLEELVLNPLTAENYLRMKENNPRKFASVLTHDFF